MSADEARTDKFAATGLRRRLLRGAMAVAVLALAWTLGIGWWLPRFLQPRIESGASALLGAPFTLDRIEIAPWTLKARAFGMRLGPAGTPWLSVGEVDADLSIESLWRFAPVLRRLTVRGPQIEIERLATDRFNITPMIEALAKRPPAPPGSGPARFAVHNIGLEDGLIHIVDRVGGSEHRVSQMRIGIPFLSNLPSQIAADVLPVIDAQIDGSQLHLQGRTQPFSEGQRSAIDLRWQRIDVARAFSAVKPLWPQALPLALQEGRLDLALQIGFERRASPAAPSLQIGGKAMLAQLRATVPAQGLHIAWERLALDDLDLRPLERRAAVGAVTLQAPALEVDLQRLLAPAAARTAALPQSSQPGLKDPAWQWRVERLALDGGHALLRDPAWTKGQLLAPIHATIAGLGSAEGKPASFTLAVADAQGGQAKLEGTVAIAARQALAHIAVAGLKPAPWAAPWQAALPVRLQEGSVALQAQAEIDAKGWSLRSGAVQIAGLQLAPAARLAASRNAGADRLVVAKADASGVQVQAAAGKAMTGKIDALHLAGLDLKASRGADGVMAWLKPPANGKAPSTRTASAAQAPRWRLGELRCSGCAMALNDRSVKPAASFAMTRTELSLRDLDSDLHQPFKFEIAALVGRGGSARARGTLRLQPLGLSSRVDIDALDLGMLQPYLDPYVNLTLTAAKAGAAGDLRVDGTARETVASTRWRGMLALKDMRAVDRLNAAEFVRFKNLSLVGSDITWRPAAFDADLGSVALDDFYGRVIINSDGRVNLRDIVRSADKQAAVSLTTPAASAAAPAMATEAAASGAPTPLRWRAIHLTGGEVDFTDNFIRPNYSARLTGINGDISALAWDNPTPAEVHITGEVDDSAPLEISGSIHPLGARLHTDITANARGIDMTRLSAYSGRYAGYGIEKGTLSAKVHYRIDQGKLEAENQLYLDQLTFGQKVDSPDALKLPVLLAVSLLRDRNGVIDINLPISGSLDDPQFSMGRIIVRVIVNLITKAVTAPFTLLSHAFGGGKHELSYAAFEPGSAEIGDLVKPVLDTLAKALADRPALKLEITGRADPTLDVPALRRAHVERLMRMAKAKATDELIDKVTIAPEERGRWLEAAYKSADNIKERPRNVIGLLKTLPAPEMEALLLQSAPADTEQLRALADRRADQVKAYLSEKVPSERLLVTASRLDAGGIDDKGKTTRVGFALK